MITASPIRWGAATLAVLAAAVSAYWYWGVDRRGGSSNPTPPTPARREATFEQVQQFCGVLCHVYPPPESFPRSAWRKEVEQGYHLFEQSKLTYDPPSKESVLAYYEKRAPRDLPMPVRPSAAGNAAERWQRRGFSLPGSTHFPEVTNVNLVRMSPGSPTEILICECDPMKNQGQVLLLNPHADPPVWKVLANVPAPAHAEAVDLDRDGHIDILVACLGSFFPTDDKVGSVVWLHRRADGAFEPITLLEGIGRVADVQAADVHGNGKLDLVVAEFGWRKTGSVLHLENRTTDWAKPNFVRRVLDERHGAIHVPVADVNRDGKPDIVALISQEHETVVAFLNEGKGQFRKETIYAAPHPGFGSSGIQVVDLDGDGNLDVLYTNGDVLDKPFLLKPYHGVHWLENRGCFPFEHHRLAEMPGVQRAVAVDVNGKGRLDVVAVSYLPAEEFARRDELALDAVLWLEQTEKGKFVHRPLETKSCDHFTCVAGNLIGNGPPSVVVGNFWSTKERPLADTLSIWTPQKLQKNGK